MAHTTSKYRKQVRRKSTKVPAVTKLAQLLSEHRAERGGTREGSIIPVALILKGYANGATNI